MKSALDSRTSSANWTVNPLRRGFLVALVCMVVLVANLSNDSGEGITGGAVDELGYLGNARYLVGGEPVLEWGRSPYGLAYSLLLTPILAATQNPAIAYQAAVDLNALLMVLLFLALYHLVSRLLGDYSIWIRLGVSALAACYPATMVYANTVFSETFLAVVFALWAIALFRAVENRESALRWAILGVSAHFAYFAHGRFLAVLLVSLGVGFWSLFSSRHRCSMWMLLGVAISLALVRIPSAPHSSRSLGHESSRSLEAALSHPGALLGNLIGQSWMALMASVGLPVFGAVIFALSPQIRVRVRASGPFWSALLLAGIGVLSVSSLFMVRGFLSRGEFTFLVYERYVSAIMPVAVALALVLILWGHKARLRFERLLLAGAGILAVNIGVLAATRAEYFDRHPYYLNTPSLGVYWSQGLAGLWRSSMAAAFAGILILALIWWLPKAGLTAGALVAAMVASHTGREIIAPFYAKRSEQVRLVQVLDALGSAFDEPVAYDSRLGGTFNLYNYSWLRPGWRIEPLNPKSETLRNRLLITTPELAKDVEGVRLVMFESIRQGFENQRLALWATPGEISELLERKGWLAPAGFPSEITPKYVNAVDIELEAPRRPLLQAHMNGRVELVLTVRAVGTMPVFDDQGLGGSDAALRLGVQVLDFEGHVLVEERVRLNRSLLPSEFAPAFISLRLRQSLVEGTYRLLVTPFLENRRWLDERSIEMALEIVS